MRVTFASEAWVDIRAPQDLTAKDKMKVLEATVLPAVNFGAGGDEPEITERLNLGMVSRQTHALLDRIISGWSYELPLPKDDISQDADGQRSWDASLLMLPIDDWNELEDAVEPHMAKLRTGPKSRGATTSGSSGFSKAAATASTRRTSAKTR